MQELIQEKLNKAGVETSQQLRAQDREVDQKLKALDKKLNEDLKKALDNPLANK